MLYINKNLFSNMEEMTCDDWAIIRKNLIDRNFSSEVERDYWYGIYVSLKNNVPLLLTLVLKEATKKYHYKEKSSMSSEKNKMKDNDLFELLKEHKVSFIGLELPRTEFYYRMGNDKELISKDIAVDDVNT